MKEFLLKFFNKKVLVRPDSNDFEYQAEWNGEGFDVTYLDNITRGEISDVEFDIKYINSGHHYTEDDLETLEGKLCKLEETRDKIEGEKFFKIDVKHEDIVEYL